jgi:hypothetical protein
LRPGGRIKAALLPRSLVVRGEDPAAWWAE